MLDLVDEPLDQIALPVEVLVVWDGFRSRTTRRDHGLSVDLSNFTAESIGVIAHVSEQVVEGDAADQVLGLADVMHLACGQDEANRIAEGVHADIDLRAQAAARTPNRLIFASPF